MGCVNPLNTFHHQPKEITMNIKSIALLASTLIASSVVMAQDKPEKSCGAGSCSKKEAKQASCSKKDSSCSKKETSANKKDASCSKKESSCSKKETSVDKK
jgi:hypothetical protein